MATVFWFGLATLALVGVFLYRSRNQEKRNSSVLGPLNRETGEQSAPNEQPDSTSSNVLPVLREEIRPVTKSAGPGLKAAPNLCLLPAEFVVIDLETTGLDPERHEIIEIGAIHVFRDSSNHLTFETLIKPNRKIPKKITSITGITQTVIDGEGIELANALSDLSDFVRDLPLVAFNAEFDMRFLRRAMKQHGYEFENRYACALKLARRAWPGLPSYRLSELAKLGNLSVSNSHRALRDCERAMIIFASAVSTHGKKIRWHRMSSDEAKQLTSV